MTSNPAYPGLAHIPKIKPPGYAEVTSLEAQPTERDTSLPEYSPPRPSVPWPGQSDFVVFNADGPTRRTRLGQRENRTLACFILLAFVLVAIFIVVVIMEVVGHLDQ